MDIFTLNPHNISNFGETGGHNMDFCGIREASKKFFGMYLKRGKIVFFGNNVIYIIFIHFENRILQGRFYPFVNSTLYTTHFIDIMRKGYFHKSLYILL